MAEGARVAITDVLDDDGAKLGEHTLYRRLVVMRETDWGEAVSDTAGHLGRVDDP